jgi:hypothetical protein
LDMHSFFIYCIIIGWPSSICPELSKATLPGLAILSSTVNGCLIVALCSCIADLARAASLCMSPVLHMSCSLASLPVIFVFCLFDFTCIHVNLPIRIHSVVSLVASTVSTHPVFVHNITAAWAVDREFLYTLGCLGSLCLPLPPFGSLCGALGLPWGALGLL